MSRMRFWKKRADPLKGHVRIIALKHCEERAEKAEAERDSYKAVVDAARGLYPHIVGDNAGLDPETAEGAFVEALDALDQQENS